ncbi:hypothetical protein BDV95DRAFT_497079 [Massariosphaeria phaeospora]|uniref:S-adenosyl-L-methionine-dependent methyltransferase n=1 Tax=Massariosphaeria phaeospora TaxID=100035 RepID=A0A7C8M835_9PLEO|nr:hypothetical protein BDV95DRAFT_497079 [Massariosphaeria phaeospora]
MPPKVTPFGSQDYWNNRFTANSHPFEWLEAPTALDPHLFAALKHTNDENPEILHIGCGTSLLSDHLRAHINNPAQIHNLDYSEVAITVGRKREVDLYANKDAIRDQLPATSKPQRPTYMRWSTANLLDHSSLLTCCQPSTYSIVVDKSTSDSIACSEDVYVPLPYPVSISRDPHSSSSSEHTTSFEPIHPLHVLAIHLALVSKPKARWISLSYSTDRFPFLHHPPPELHKQELERAGLPNPGTLWRLEAKYEIEVPPAAAPEDSNGTIHRPQILHWVYVLERTDVEVAVRDS